MTDDLEAEGPDQPTMGSVSRWIAGLKTGDEQAAYELWRRYFQRLVALARGKLQKLSHQTGLADEEDVAVSAFHCLCAGATHGRFDQLDDREDLWRLLVVITSRKASNQKQRESRKKRGGGRAHTVMDDPRREASFWDLVPSEDPTPEFAAMLAEEYQRRLEALGKDELRRIAVMRMEGFGNEEIAERLGCAVRTVARRLEIIREAWSGAVVAADDVP